MNYIDRRRRRRSYVRVHIHIYMYIYIGDDTLFTAKGARDDASIVCVCERARSRRKRFKLLSRRLSGIGPTPPRREKAKAPFLRWFSAVTARPTYIFIYIYITSRTAGGGRPSTVHLPAGQYCCFSTARAVSFRHYGFPSAPIYDRHCGAYARPFTAYRCRCCCY